MIFFQQNISIGMDEYSLAVYQDVSDIMLRSRKILMQGIGFCVVILGIVGIIIYCQIRRLLLPLYELKCAATRIAQGNYDNCVIFSEKNEIGELTACFQQMTIQIREHIEAVTARNRQQKQLLGSLAHEMRTPLTAVLANADMLLTLRLSPDEQNKALVFIIDEAKRMTHLSEKLLMLSGLCEPNDSPLELRELTIQAILVQHFLIPHTLSTHYLRHRRVVVSQQCHRIASFLRLALTKISSTKYMGIKKTLY